MRKRKSDSPLATSPITRDVFVDQPAIDIGIAARPVDPPVVGTEAEWRAVNDAIATDTYSNRTNADLTRDDDGTLRDALAGDGVALATQDETVETVAVPLPTVSEPVPTEPDTANWERISDPSGDYMARTCGGTVAVCDAPHRSVIEPEPVPYTLVDPPDPATDYGEPAILGKLIAPCRSVDAANGGDGPWTASPPVTFPDRAVTNEELADYPTEPEQYEDPPIACGTFTLTAAEQDAIVRSDPRLVPLGDALRSARERSGKTMGEVACALSHPVTWVSDVERGRILPDSIQIVSIFDVIGGPNAVIYTEWSRSVAKVRGFDRDLLFTPIPFAHDPDIGMFPLWDPVMVEDEWPPAGTGPMYILDDRTPEYDPKDPHMPTPDPTPTSPEEYARRVLADPLAAVLVYAAIHHGHVPLATWNGRSLVRVGTDEPIGSISRSCPPPGSRAEPWSAKCGGVPMVPDVETESSARAWVESRAGMAVVVVPGREEVRRVMS